MADDPFAAGGGGNAAAAAVAAGATGTGAANAGTTTGTGTTTPPVAWHSEFFKADGEINRDVFGKLPEQFRTLGEGELKNVKNAEGLLSKIDGLSKLAGRKALAPLPANASAEDVAAHNAVLRAVNGAPEKADGYGFKRPDNLPEEAWSDDYAKSVMELLHKYHAPPALAKALFDNQTKLTTENITAQAKYRDEFFAGQENAFRESLKKSGDDYDKAMNSVTLTAQKFGMDPNDVVLKNAGVRSMLLAVAKATGEPEFKAGTGAEPNTKSDEVLAKAIMHDKTNPDHEAYWNGQHPKNREVKQRVENLLKSHYEKMAAARK
jgi:hypothetical protein